MKKRLMTMAVMAMTVMMMTMPMTVKAEDAPLQPGDTGVADDGTPYTVDPDGFVNFGNVDYSTDNGQQGRDWEARNAEATAALNKIVEICQRDGIQYYDSDNMVKSLATYQYVDSLIQSKSITAAQANKVLKAAGTNMTDLGAAQEYYEKNYAGGKTATPAAPATPDTTKKDTPAKTDTAKANTTAKADTQKQKTAAPAAPAETIAADAPTVSTYEDNYLPIEQVSGNDVSANDISANEATVTAETETGSVSDNALVSSQPEVTVQKSNTARNVGVGAGIAIIIAAIGIVVKKKFF